MPQLLDPKTNDVHVVGDELVDYYRRQGWVDYVDPELVAAAAAALELKGADLDEALDDAGLPKSGKADERRQRLADQATPNTPKE